MVAGWARVRTRRAVRGRRQGGKVEQEKGEGTRTGGSGAEHEYRKHRIRMENTGRWETGHGM